jgi:hypothetical protein
MDKSGLSNITSKEVKTSSNMPKCVTFIWLHMGWCQMQHSLLLWYLQLFRYSHTKLHRVKSQTTETFTVSAMRTPNLILSKQHCSKNSPLLFEVGMEDQLPQPHIQDYKRIWINERQTRLVFRRLLKGSFTTSGHTYCGVFTQTAAKQRLHKQISTEKLLSIRSASRTLLCNAEVNTSLHCFASLLQLVDTQQ